MLGWELLGLPSLYGNGYPRGRNCFILSLSVNNVGIVIHQHSDPLTMNPTPISLPTPERARVVLFTQYLKTYSILVTSSFWLQTMTTGTTIILHDTLRIFLCHVVRVGILLQPYPSFGGNDEQKHQCPCRDSNL